MSIVNSFAIVDGGRRVIGTGESADGTVNICKVTIMNTEEIEKHDNSRIWMIRKASRRSRIPGSMCNLSPRGV